MNQFIIQASGLRISVVQLTKHDLYKAISESLRYTETLKDIANIANLPSWSLVAREKNDLTYDRSEDVCQKLLYKFKDQLKRYAGIEDFNVIFPYAGLLAQCFLIKCRFNEEGRLLIVNGQTFTTMVEMHNKYLEEKLRAYSVYTPKRYAQIKEEKRIINTIHYPDPWDENPNTATIHLLDMDGFEPTEISLSV